MRDKHHVLIVSAAPGIEGLWERALERAGYHVSCVGRGATALQRLAMEHIDVVIIDVPLSDMAADVLAVTIRERWPDTCVLLRAGAELAARHDLADDAGLRLLPPVVTTPRLKKYLEQVLQPAASVRASARYDTNPLQPPLQPR